MLPHKPDGDTWGLPAGKVDGGESDLSAIRRELFEETGYLANNSDIELLEEHDFTSPKGDDYIFVAFQVKLASPHDVIIEKAAHSECQWLTIEEADSRSDLIYGLYDLFRLVGFIK